MFITRREDRIREQGRESECSESHTPETSRVYWEFQGIGNWKEQGESDLMYAEPPTRNRGENSAH